MLEVAAPAVKQLRAIAADIRGFDRAGLEMRTGVEAGVVVGAVVVLGYAWQGDGAACAMGIGALLVGVTRVASPDGPSLGAMVGATLAMSVSTVMGSVAVNHSVLLVALLILWGFLGGLLVATGPAGGPIGVMAIVGLVAFGHIEPWATRGRAGGTVRRTRRCSADPRCVSSPTTGGGAGRGSAALPGTRRLRRAGAR